MADAVIWCPRNRQTWFAIWKLRWIVECRLLMLLLRHAKVIILKALGQGGMSLYLCASRTRF